MGGAVFPAEPEAQQTQHGDTDAQRGEGGGGHQLPAEIAGGIYNSLALGGQNTAAQKYGKLPQLVQCVESCAGELPQHDQGGGDPQNDVQTAEGQQCQNKFQAPVQHIAVPIPEVLHGIAAAHHRQQNQAGEQGAPGAYQGQPVPAIPAAELERKAEQIEHGHDILLHHHGEKKQGPGAAGQRHKGQPPTGG